MLKLALSKDYLNFCEQDHSGLIYLFGSDFAESSKRAEATDWMYQSLSSRKPNKSSSTTFSRLGITF